ncbi:hypothetical protein RJ55_01443 [Drechmeria coniospora]|nr:hypothetical protein RJ55_01443 [Drechmeria coniospora]
MKIPYNQVHCRGDILFAVRGGKIHSFNLPDGKHISTWQHPDVEKVTKAREVISETKSEKEPSVDVDDDVGVDESEPPAKRQKTDAGVDNKAVVDDAAEDRGAGQPCERKGKSKESKAKNKKTHHESKKHQVARVPDRPVVTLLTSTEDGRHVLAVSGHDKVIWVFAHDGHGSLTRLSQRTMPKRPSAVTITPEAQIMCADKFGDVYSLPLIMNSTSAESAPRVSTPNPVAKTIVLEANPLTVHSKRNREALDNQRKQLELKKKRGEEPAKDEEPAFELTLLLGHVSLLTTLVLGKSDSRRYIITGDRDEHIRVSRYVPQAHIIEGFCLGHKQFVSEIMIPSSRDEILVSGGGDEELFVWDWKAGKVLSTTNLLLLAQANAPETAKIAVTGLYSFVHSSESGEVVYVLAICESVNSIFSWQLTASNVLDHVNVIQLPATPLHLSVAASDGTTLPRLIVAMDPSQVPQAKSLQMFTLEIRDGRLAIDTEPSIHEEGLEADEVEASEQEVRSLLYTVENLRKQTDGAENAEADVDGAEVGGQGPGAEV